MDQANNSNQITPNDYPRDARRGALVFFAFLALFNLLILLCAMIEVVRRAGIR